MIRRSLICPWLCRLHLWRCWCGQQRLQSQRPVCLFAQLQRTELWRVCTWLLWIPRLCQWVCSGPSIVGSIGCVRGESCGKRRISALLGLLWPLLMTLEQTCTFSHTWLAQNVRWHVDLFATGSWNMGYMWTSSFYGIIFLKIDNWELLTAGSRSQFSPFRYWICWSLIIKQHLSVSHPQPAGVPQKALTVTSATQCQVSACVSQGWWASSVTSAPLDSDSPSVQVTTGWPTVICNQGSWCHKCSCCLICNDMTMTFVSVQQ